MELGSLFICPKITLPSRIRPITTGAFSKGPIKWIPMFWSRLKDIRPDLGNTPAPPKFIEPPTPVNLKPTLCRPPFRRPRHGGQV